MLLIGAAAGVGGRAATDLATGKLAAGLTAGARAGRAAALAFVVLRGLEGEEISGGEGHDESEEKEHDLLHVGGVWRVKGAS